MNFEVKNSKTVFVISILSCTLLEIVIGFVFMLAISDFFDNNASNDNLIIAIIVFCGFSVFLLLLLGCEIYLIKSYKNKRDIFTETKMYRKIKNTILFEVDYSNISEIRCGLIHSCITCNCPYKRYDNGLKTTAFLVEYSSKDLERVINCIKSYNSHFSINKN